MTSKRDVGYSSIIVVIIVVVVCCLASGLVESKGLVKGKVSKVKNSNSGHSTTTSDLPSSVAVAVTLGQRALHLTLAKEAGFTDRLPVLLLSTDKRGTLHADTARLRQDDYAVYQDITGEAAFGVFLEKDVNGSSHYRLEGIVHSGGKIYNLKSTGNRPQFMQRMRRDAATEADDQQEDISENDDNIVDDNDNKGDASDDKLDDEDSMDDEEFEVDEILQNLANNDDFLSPDVHTKVKQKVVETSFETLSIPSLAFPDHSDSPTLSPIPTTPADKRNEERRRGERRRRRKRQVAQDIYIDVVAVADYKRYLTWYERSTGTTPSQKKQEALENIRRYYAFVMNGVNLLYKGITSLSYKINVRLVGLVISVTTESSPWTEQNKISGTQDKVDAYAALPALASWAKSTDLLPAYDHLMLFTGYDLSKTLGGITTNGMTGLAYRSTVCETGGQATSVTEDLGGFQCVGTAAHELGHGLSAEHDGVNNVCRFDDQYIMAANSGDVNSANKLNPWKFSPCSVNYFKSFFQERVDTARGQQCLYNTLPVNTTIPDVTSQYPGQLYDPDAQCRMAYGPSSRFCRSVNDGKIDEICTDMYCYDPSTSGTCYQLQAARGTTCGSQKWCLNGQCVADPAAPIADESCVFGDQPGIAFQDQDCASFVDTFPGYCYQSSILKRCCSSCARHHLLLSGCEYGDIAFGCYDGYCRWANQSQLQKCCGTCNYGDPFTTTPPTTLFPPTLSAAATTTPTAGTTTNIPIPIIFTATTTTPTTTTATPTTTITMSITTTTTPTTTITTPITTIATPTTTIATPTTTIATPTTTIATPTTTTATPTTTIATPTTTIATPTTTIAKPTTTIATPTTTITTPTAAKTTPTTTPPSTTSPPIIPTLSTRPTMPPSTTISSLPTTGICEDSASFTFNAKSCTTLLISQPEECYNFLTRSQCCQSCQTIHTGVAGCEYGDRQPSTCSAALTEREACSTLQSVCCNTCTGYQAPTAAQPALFDVTVYVTLSFCVMLTLFFTPVAV